MRILLIFVVVGLSKALDVSLVGYTCDQSLPVTADIYLQCNNSSRCTFGEFSTVYGKLYYNNVDQSGITDDLAYVTADIALWTLSFNLFDMMATDLCSDSLIAEGGNNNECPGNGAYDFSMAYKLPSAGDPQTSWVASGWSGTGEISMYAQQNKNMLIGQCSLELETFVTKADKSSLLGTPSAAVTTGLVLGVLAVCAALGLYCYLCRRKRERKSKKLDDEVETFFKRMEDERTVLSSAKSSKSLANKTITIHKGSDTVVSELDPVPA